MPSTNALGDDQMAAGTGEPVQKPAFTLSLPGAGTPIAPVARDVSDTCGGAPTGRLLGETHGRSLAIPESAGVRHGQSD